MAIFDSEKCEYREYRIPYETGKGFEILQVYSGKLGKIAVKEKTAFLLDKKGKAKPCSFSAFLKGFASPYAETFFIPLENETVAIVPCERVCMEAMEIFEKRLSSFSETPKNIIVRADFSKKEIFFLKKGRIVRLRIENWDFTEEYPNLLPFLLETEKGYVGMAYRAGERSFGYAVVFFGTDAPFTKTMEVFEIPKGKESASDVEIAIFGGKITIFKNGTLRVFDGSDTTRSFSAEADPKRAIYGAIVMKNKIFLPVGRGFYEKERVFDEGAMVLPRDPSERASLNLERMSDPPFGSGRLVMDAEGYPVFVSPDGKAAVYRDPSDGSPKRILFEGKAKFPPTSGGVVPGRFFMEKKDEIYAVKASFGEDGISFEKKRIRFERKPSSFFFTGYENGVLSGYLHFEEGDKTEPFFHMAETGRTFVGSRFGKIPVHSVSSGEKTGSAVLDTVSGTLFFGNKEIPWDRNGPPLPEISASYLFEADGGDTLLYAAHPKKGSSLLKILFFEKNGKPIRAETIDIGDFGTVKPSADAFRRYLSHAIVRSASHNENALRVEIKRNGEYGLILFETRGVTFAKRPSNFYFLSEKEDAIPFYPHKTRMKHISKNEYAIVGEEEDPLFPSFRVYGRKAEYPKLAAVLLFTAPLDNREPTLFPERGFSPRRA